MNFTRLENHKNVRSGSGSDAFWRTIYHREGRRSARQKTRQLSILEWGTYGWHPVGEMDCERHEFDEDTFCECGKCCPDWDGIDELDLPADSPLWQQISALAEFRRMELQDGALNQ